MIVGMRHAHNWVVLAAVVAASASIGTEGLGAKTNPCAPLGSWATSARVAAERNATRAALSPVAWRALEAGPYYVCDGNRAESGGFYATAYKVPIARVGHRVWLRILAEQGSHAEAEALARRVRGSFSGIFDGYGAHPRVLAVRVVGRFLIVGVTTVRTR